MTPDQTAIYRALLIEMSLDRAIEYCGKIARAAIDLVMIRDYSMVGRHLIELREVRKTAAEETE